MTAGGVRASGKLNAAVQRVFYVGLAFAVKVECKMVARLFGCRPYKYMGRYCPKEGKNREKVKFLLQDILDLLYEYCKRWCL